MEADGSSIYHKCIFIPFHCSGLPGYVNGQDI
jgi:hypothetical protein